MADPPRDRRSNQKLRTRKALLEAAHRLASEGRKPSLEEIAEAALVSRATAYRYFPSLEALMLEASLHVAIPEADEILAGAPEGDAVARLERVDTALHDMVLANEPALRMMLANALERSIREQGADVPGRQNRRTPLIEAALAPVRSSFDPRSLEMLKPALAILVGTEGMVVIKDVLQLDDATARQVKRWAIRALVEAAARPPTPADS